MKTRYAYIGIALLTIGVAILTVTARNRVTFHVAPSQQINDSVLTAAQTRTKNLQDQTGTLEKLIVENGSVTMEVDLDRLGGHAQPSGKLDQTSSQIFSELRFVVAANSFFSFLVFNDLPRGPEQGSMVLLPQSSAPPHGIPASLGASLNQLVVEKLPSGEQFDLAVRDAKTGFTFFNIEGHQYDYDAKAQSLSVTGGRLLVSKQFSSALGQPSDAGAVVGTMSIGAVMQSIEVTHVVNGAPKSVSMPPLNNVAGPQAQARVSGRMLSSETYPT